VDEGRNQAPSPPSEAAVGLSWIDGQKNVAGQPMPLAGCTADSRPGPSPGQPSRGTGSSLTTWSWCQTANWRLCASTWKRTLHPASLRTEVVGGQIDIDAAIPTHMSQIHLLIQRGQPGIRVNPRLRGLVRWARRVKATQGGTFPLERRLSGTFVVVVLEKCLCDGRVTSCSVLG
jgi:hypothetical protein